MVGHVVEPAPDQVTGPRPLVLFLHGRHDVCYKPGKKNRGSGTWPCTGKFKEIPSHLGYVYVAERPRVAGLHDRVDPGERHQRPGLPAGRRRRRRPVVHRAQAPRLLEHHRRRAPDRPVEDDPGRPQPRRRGGRPRLDRHPAVRAVQDRRPGAGRADRLRVAHRAVRPDRDAAALLRRRRLRHPGPEVHRHRPRPDDRRHLAQELGAGDGRQPQPLQHRVDAGARRRRRRSPTGPPARATRAAARARATCRRPASGPSARRTSPARSSCSWATTATCRSSTGRT